MINIQQLETFEQLWEQGAGENQEYCMEEMNVTAEEYIEIRNEYLESFHPEYFAEYYK